ncbi:putative ankyrin repeat protein RF_0381 [Cloeon dipterum]|uniref:putative ankyrin repeat protein RF_0381 n=1 Tax=Cloeon dipterum TaxID=197152 RepID=UPI00321FECA9
MLYCTPLTVSARFGHLDLVKFLLEGQIDSLQAELEEKWFAFKCAVFEEHTDVAKYLLEKYPEMKNMKVESAESPLHLAVESESLDLCRWIVDEAGADLNSLMPIGKPEDADDIYCDFFLMLQSDVNKKDGRGKTALNCAAEYGFLELLRKLINSGANVQEKDINGWNAFHYACENSGRNCYEMIKLLHSEAKEKPVGSCQTGLHIYLRNCDGNEGDIMEIVRFLIEKAGVDVKAVDEDGRTALCIAVERKLRCTDYLMMQGIDVGFKNKKGESRLHLAAKRNDLRVLNVWLNLGGDLNVRDGKESTALHVAIVHESVAFIKRLVELGVDVNAMRNV